MSSFAPGNPEDSNRVEVKTVDGYQGREKEVGASWSMFSSCRDHLPAGDYPVLRANTGWCPQSRSQGSTTRNDLPYGPFR